MLAGLLAYLCVQAETYQSQLEPRMAEMQDLREELRCHDKELLATATQLLVRGGHMGLHTQVFVCFLEPAGSSSDMGASTNI